MKGKDLLEAMEYLEDEIIEAANEKKLRRRDIKRRVLVSFAACFSGILVLLSVCIFQVTKARRADKENLPNPVKNEGVEEVLIPSAGDLYLGADIRAISEGNIYLFNLKWKETEDKRWGIKEGFDFFYDFMNLNKIQVAGKAFSTSSDYGIVGDYGALLCSVASSDGSMSAGYMLPTFNSYWSPYTNFHMVQYSPEELEMYLRKIKKNRSTIQGQIDYLVEHFNETDYGGSYYATESEKYTVWLIDESRRKELEQQGMVCRTASYSLQQLYEKMHELWDMREELEIIDISVFSYQNKLFVTGALEEEEFREKLNNADWSDMISYYGYEMKKNSTEIQAYAGMNGARGIEDADEFMRFIQFLYNSDSAVKMMDTQEYFDNLKTALVKLKEKYPEYTYLQLYYHVSTDCEYEYYLNFDKELENFVDSLPAYKKDMDFLREQQYGDPQRLGLKAVLYYYKQLYPKKSYQDIYETYPVIQDLEQKNTCSKAEKLYQYLYIKAMQKEELKEKIAADSKEKRNLIYLLFGCAIMFVLTFTCIFFRKKHMEKAEFRYCLIRETVALSANLALFIILPYLLRLIFSMEIMSAVFLPDYYSGPIFGLIGSAIYVRKRGKWWNFMLYTTVCLILQPLAVLWKASSLYMFLLYVLPAEIIGTLFGKLKGKIKIVK